MRKLRRQIPSMNALFAFESAGRLLNFSRAADDLNVTPAAVSRMMQRLEDHMGVVLFQRGGAGVRLSPAGQVLHDATSRAMTQIEQAVSEIEPKARDSDSVTISLSTAFTTHWLMPRMARFKAALPGVDLRFQLVMGAITGPVDDVDLGMRFLTSGIAGHRVFPIAPEVVMPICSPTYQQGQGSTTAGRTWIRLSEGDARPTGGASGDATLDAPNSLFFADYAIVVQAALLGQGICWGWMNVCSHWLRERQLVPFGSRLHLTDRMCCLLQRDNRPARPVVDAVREWIVAELQSDHAALQQIYPALGIPDAPRDWPG